MARDIIHEIVKKAFINDGWKITDDPFILKLIDDKKSYEVDLGAEKLIGIEKGITQILIEIKSFAGSSTLHQFHETLGQYLDYRDAIEEGNVNRDLYLAVSANTYEQLIGINFIQRRIKKYGLKFVVVNLSQRKIKSWIK